MATILKAFDAGAAAALPFSLDDMAQTAAQCLAEARAEADRIIEQAAAEADGIRRAAQLQGRQAATLEADRAVHETIAAQMESLLPSLKQAVCELERTRQDWLERWEQSALRLSIGIAERIVRRELSQTPQITLDWLKEALQLAASTADLQVRLHPEDFDSLGLQAERLAQEIGRLGRVQISPDAQIERGGCRIDSQFGSIDQQLCAQLARVEQELA